MMSAEASSNSGGLSRSPLTISSTKPAIFEGVFLVPNGGMGSTTLHVDNSGATAHHPDLKDISLHDTESDLCICGTPVRVFTANIWEHPQALNAGNRIINTGGGASNPLSKLLLTMAAVIIRCDGNPFTLEQYKKNIRMSAPVPAPRQTQQKKPLLLGNLYESRDSDSSSEEDSEEEREEESDGIAGDSDDDVEEWVDDEVQAFELEEEVGTEDTDDDDDSSDSEEEQTTTNKRTVHKRKTKTAGAPAATPITKWRSRVTAKKKGPSIKTAFEKSTTKKRKRH